MSIARWRFQVGMTLLELLAVLVVLSLLAAYGASGLARMHEHSDARTVAAALRDLDARGRLAAQSGRVCRLDVASDGLLRLLLHPTDDVIAEVTLPGRAVVSLHRSSGEATTTIEFDRTGCSIDYRVVVRRGDHMETWSVSGLTGSMLEAVP